MEQGEKPCLFNVKELYSFYFWPCEQSFFFFSRSGVQKAIQMNKMYILSAVYMLREEQRKHFSGHKTPPVFKKNKKKTLPIVHTTYDDCRLHLNRTLKYFTTFSVATKI